MLIKMFIQSPAILSYTTYAVHNCNQQTPSKVYSHEKPSQYITNSIAKANT